MIEKHLIGAILFVFIVGTTYLASAYTSEPEFKMRAYRSEVRLSQPRLPPRNHPVGEELPEVTSKAISLSYDLRTRSFTAVFELRWNRNTIPDETVIVDMGLVEILGKRNQISKTFRLTKPFKKGTTVRLKRTWKDPEWKATAENIQAKTPIYFGNATVRKLTPIQAETLLFKEPNYMGLSVPVDVIPK